MLSTAVDHYVLERIAIDNEIHAAVFLPFTIVRLQESAPAGREAVLLVHLRAVGGTEDRSRSLRLTWSETSVPKDSLPVQEDAVTEWAACGIACVLVPLYADMAIVHVAQAGDRFDYWISDGEEDYILEVSGTIRGSLEHRHLVKVRQLSNNPYGVDGYVAVTRFSSREAIFSFSRFGEET